MTRFFRDFHLEKRMYLVLPESELQNLTDALAAAEEKADRLAEFADPGERIAIFKMIQIRRAVKRIEVEAL